MERTIRTGKHTAVVCTDEPGAGGACHKYDVRTLSNEIIDDIGFQIGPIQDAGVNGVQNEDLLAVVIDRLEHFQAGPFPCEENAIALDAAKNALRALDLRTLDRTERKVEGLNEA